MSLAWLTQPGKTTDTALRQVALAHPSQLTKPPGSLGALEDIAARLASLQGGKRPRVEHVRISVFAGDHGVVEEGVSAFPQAVTVEMVRPFARGGAAISVLARSLGARLEAVNVGTVSDPGALPGVIHAAVAADTASLCRGPAMTEDQMARALTTGRAAAERAHDDGMDLFIGGEMGIGNATPASALACAVLQRPAAEWVGRGTGLDEAGVRRKAQVVGQALARHAGELHTIVDILRCLGGLEIAALTGAYLRCAQLGIPVLLDGFISSVAALLALRLAPAAGAWFFYAQQSSEAGHASVLADLKARAPVESGHASGRGQRGRRRLAVAAPGRGIASQHGQPQRSRCLKGQSMITLYYPYADHTPRP